MGVTYTPLNSTWLIEAMYSYRPLTIETTDDQPIPYADKTRVQRGLNQIALEEMFLYGALPSEVY